MKGLSSLCRQYNSLLPLYPSPWHRHFVIRSSCVILVVLMLSTLDFSIGYGQSLSDQLDRETVEQFVAQQQARIDAIARAKQATISVFAPAGDNGGSGVIVHPDGYAITNFHVVRPCGNFMRCSLPNGQLYEAVLVGIDPVGDVALIQLIGDEPFPVATLANSDDVQVGQWCFAIGNPFLLATNFQPTVSFGIVSGVHRYQEPAGTLLEYTDCLQTDAAINPGNSGGPLFNAHGELIGINGRGSFEKRGRVNVGVGYAISINQVKNFFGCLMSGRILDHATMGATVSADDSGRVVVSNLLMNSDAYRRGLRIGDEIVRLGDRSILSANDFKNVLGIFPRGWRVPLVFRRDNMEFSTMIRLTGVHSPEQLVEMIQGADSPSKPKPDEIPEPQPSRDADDETDKAVSKEPLPFSAKVSERMIERHGFANEFFNLRGRERVWQGIRPHGSTELPAAKFELSISGKWEQTAPFRALLSIDQAGLEIDGRAELFDPSSALDDQLGPRGSNGMLLALMMWHRALNSPVEKFGAVTYYGSVPYDGGGPLYDMVVATYESLECRFYLDPQSNRLAILEVAAGPDVDASVLRFSDYSIQNGIDLPQRIEVWTAESLYGRIEIDQYEVSPMEAGSSSASDNEK